MTRSREVRADISVDEFRAVVLGSYEDVREEFKVRFGPGIDNFVLLMHKVYGHIQTMESRVPYDERSAWTYQYLYVSMNNLICAFHLQISGFPIPAGNLMRQFGEGLAIALLCSHKGIDTFSRIRREGDRFPAHKSLEMLRKRRNRRLLGIDGTRLAELDKITAFYDESSHPGLWAASAMEVFSEPGMKALGGAFDEKKLDFYNGEIRYSHVAAMMLHEAAHLCEKNLNSTSSEEN